MSNPLAARDTVSFEVSLEDQRKISLIMNRAKIATAEDGKLIIAQEDRINVSMSLAACIANGCPLDLDRLLAADDFNFWHDVAGIDRHMDRTTGKLLNCFLPRFARKQRGG